MNIKALLLITLCAATAGLSACKSRTVTAAERELLFTAEQLSPWLEEGMLDSSAGVFSKPFSFGSDELEYEYESENLFVSSGIHVESSASEASSTFTMLGLGINIGLGGENIEKRACDDAFSIGDESKCAYLATEGITLGQYVMVREGRRVLFVIIAGIELEADDLRTLITPHVTRMSDYNP